MISNPLSFFLRIANSEERGGADGGVWQAVWHGFALIFSVLPPT